MSTQITPKSIEIQAYAFGKLAMDLFNAHLTKLPTNDAEATQIAHIGVPFAVNGALAIELYLKTLHKIHSKSFPRSHELSKLFDELPVAAKTAVNNAASDWITKNNLPSGTNWREYIKEVSDVFVQIRYLFDQKQNMKLPIFEIAHLLEILSTATINELNRK